MNWNAATSNFVDVDAYRIQIRTKDSAVFAEQTVNCDGSKNPVLAERQCMIPMVSLRTEPFNLLYQDPVIVKIFAHNARGWSDPYPLNDEATAP